MFSLLAWSELCTWFSHGKQRNPVLSAAWQWWRTHLKKILKKCRFCWKVGDLGNRYPTDCMEQNNKNMDLIIVHKMFHLSFSVHSLLLRFTEDTFDPEQSATIGECYTCWAVIVWILGHISASSFHIEAQYSFLFFILFWNTMW